MLFIDELTLSVYSEVKKKRPNFVVNQITISAKTLRVMELLGVTESLSDTYLGPLTQ